MRIRRLFYPKQKDFGTLRHTLNQVRRMLRSNIENQFEAITVIAHYELPPTLSDANIESCLETVLFLDF